MTTGDIRARFHTWKARRRAATWIRNGRAPGASGYASARWHAIERALAAEHVRTYGYDDAGLDERVVEYPWALHRLAARHAPDGRILDAGSVLNHPRILAHCRRARLTPLSLVTLRFEGHAQVSDDVRYEFGDLRVLPYRDEWFSAVVCLSTLEHVGMDNAMYGDSKGASADPSREVAHAMRELRRVTRPGGALFLSVPFGKRDQRGWFRIFDAGDIEPVLAASGWRVDETRVFRSTREGWRESSMGDAQDAGYNEPAGGTHARRRTAPECVSAAEAVALVELTAIRS